MTNTPRPRALGPRGAAIIRGKEGYRDVAYKPTPNDVWTLGFGHTSGVKEGQRCTPEEAEAWFREDTAAAVAAVAALPCPLSDSAFDALVSLVYNAGAGSIAPGSTIGSELRMYGATRDIRHLFNAWAAIAAYRKQAGADMRGLAARRAAEMALFMEDKFPVSSP